MGESSAASFPSNDSPRVPVLIESFGDGGTFCMASNRVESGGYQLFTLALCLYAIGALTVQTLVTLDPQVLQILQAADYAVCAVFLSDFAYSVWTAPNRWRYFVTWGWLDLLSSIPTLDAARFARLARVLRVIRVLRGLRSAKVVAATLLRHRAKNSVLAALLIGILLMVICSISILQFESTAAGANIQSAEDALWWALTTMTTVGYGDRFPVTTEGRAVAGVLMVFGVGLFSALAGFLAAWFLAPEQRKEDTEIAELRRVVIELKMAIEQLAKPQAEPAATGVSLATGISGGECHADRTEKSR